MAGPTSERAVVFCVGAVQFVNILDFRMVMPLGPDFAAALDIPSLASRSCRSSSSSKRA